MPEVSISALLACLLLWLVCQVPRESLLELEGWKIKMSVEEVWKRSSA